MWISFALTLLISPQLKASECSDTKIRRQVEPQKYVEEVVSLCDTQDGVHFSSPDCRTPEACAPGKDKWKKRPLKSDIGSPGFAACEMLQGSPQFIEILREKTWYVTDLCFFGPKKFIDNDRIYRLYRSL